MAAEKIVVLLAVLQFFLLLPELSHFSVFAPSPSYPALLSSLESVDRITDELTSHYHPPPPV